jgi:hypothetical protein
MPGRDQLQSRGFSTAHSRLGLYVCNGKDFSLLPPWRTQEDAMHLVETNYFGPQEYCTEIVTYPPYIERIKMKRYGYETYNAIYDVCIPEKPVGEAHLTRWYKTNGRTELLPSSIHLAIEKHYNI